MNEQTPSTARAADALGAAGSNQAGMRDHNERLVLTILRHQGALPKAEIARRTGLSAQTVSVIMRALENDGLLERGEKVRGRIGQPSIPMALSPNGAYFLGLKVGRRSAELLLVDFVGHPLAHVTETYAFPTPKSTMAFVIRAVKKVMAKLTSAERSRVSGMGIAIPFFLWEWAAVIGIDPDEMEEWRDFDLCAELNALFEFPVFLGNDASCACGAELVFGSADAPRDYLYFYLAYFVGGGIVLNGSLFAGVNGNAGAIGPFPILAKGGEARQLVDVASFNSLERIVLERGGRVGAMWETPPRWDFDRAALDAWLDEAAPALAHAILATVSIVDFGAVLVDGHMPEDMRDVLVERIARELAGMNLSGLTAPDILPGSVGSRARALGAASLPLSRRFMV